jgi:hypothetical protein
LLAAVRDVPDVTGHYVQTLTRLTARRFDDIARDREKGCLSFLSGLVACIKLDQAEMDDVGYRGSDYRVVITTAPIEVTVELP